MFHIRSFSFDKKILVEHRNNIIAAWIFAISFGLVEAMVVIYLRHILATTAHDIFSNALSLSTRASLFSLGYVVFLRPEVVATWDTLHLEIFRELATMVMLVTVAYLVGRNMIERIAYYFMCFGVWDIFYYIWLRLFTHLPKSVFDIDVLFLIPVPWIGPVWVPTLISVVMIAAAFYLLGLKKVTIKE
jgi:hypothetical protein